MDSVTCVKQASGDVATHLVDIRRAGDFKLYNESGAESYNGGSMLAKVPTSVEELAQCLNGLKEGAPKFWLHPAFFPTAFFY